MKKNEVKKVEETKELKSAYESALLYEAQYPEGIDKILETIGKTGGFFYDSAARCWVETASDEERKEMLIELGYCID
jgi:hypothetical protein